MPKYKFKGTKAKGFQNKLTGSKLQKSIIVLALSETVSLYHGFQSLMKPFQGSLW